MIMWLFTKYGFYSAVCARQGDGNYGHPVDESRVMVRARLREHLETLISRFKEQLEGVEIKEFPGSDYAYRVILPKSTWSRIVAELVEEMNYDNFKSEVATYQGAQGADYERALHDVWEVMHQLQR